MRIIFCEDPLRPRKVDEMYQPEADAITAQGLKYAVVNYESLVNEGDPIQAVKRVPSEQQPTIGIYRGWMLKPNQYAELYNALTEKGFQLINEPQAYRHCHYLPESYSIIERYTPKSVWIDVSGAVQIDEIMALLAPFGSRPIVVKDFVKSQKHYWKEACFIPSALDREAVERVVNRFLELQGDFLNEGLVFREFIEFEPLTVHSKSGMPLSKEFRVFVLDGEPLYVVEYWEEGVYQELSLPLGKFSEVMQKVKSRFFTMDIAKRKDGEWMIIELGDAQVAGLPDSADIRKFYEALAERLLTHTA
jgi:hypothetical protein